MERTTDADAERTEADERTAWARRSASASLALAFCALVLRYVYVANKSFAYDEATYIELAAHPFRSSFYPDALFVRHPPIFPVFMWAWTNIVGVSEAMSRLPAFLFCGGAIWCVWDGVRRAAGDAAATLCGVLLASCFPLLVYGLQATMYPLAFFFAALAFWLRVTRRPNGERWALIAFALTHLFGFVFLGFRVLTSRDRRRELLATSPAWIWVGLVTVAVLVVRNPLGPASGPVWQALRSFEFFYDILTDQGRALGHLYAFLLMVLMLNPLLLESLWFGPDRTSAWARASLLLVVFFFTGPPFLRYSLLLVPAVLGLGLLHSPRVHTWRHLGVLSLVLSAAAMTSATAYVNSGLEPEASYDVPGLIDWREVADIVNASSAPSMITSSPPPPAYYLHIRHGYDIVDSRHGPDELRMKNANGREVVILRGLTSRSLADSARNGSLVVVPQNFAGIMSDLLRDRLVVCLKVSGAYVLADPNGAGCSVTKPAMEQIRTDTL